MNADSESHQVGTDEVETVSEKNKVLTANDDENTADSVDSEGKDGVFDDDSTELSTEENKGCPTSSSVTNRQDDTERACTLTLTDENDEVEAMSKYQEHRVRTNQISEDPDDFQDSKTLDNENGNVCEKTKSVTCWTKNTSSTTSILQEKPFKDSQLLDSVKTAFENIHSRSASTSKQDFRPLTSATTASQIKNAPCFKTFPPAFEPSSSNKEREPLSSFQSERKTTPRMACCYCNRWCLYWNVCKECMFFLCDSCMALYHPQTLLHATFRAKAFSDFGCLDHLMIFQYFCCDCNTRRCKECLKSRKCKGHVLMDIFTNSDYIEASFVHLRFLFDLKFL
jgi:hypothetical protein